jgi:hypothetical protein
MKVEYKGYRIWAILQTNGKYRACFLKSLTGTDDKTDVCFPLIEAETERKAIAQAKKLLDGTKS